MELIFDQLFELKLSSTRFDN